MKMTLKQAIEYMEKTGGLAICSEASNVLLTHARATEHAQYIGKRVYYNGVKGMLRLVIELAHTFETVSEPENIRPISSVTLDELKQAYCELNGVDDVEVEG